MDVDVDMVVYADGDGIVEVNAPLGPADTLDCVGIPANASMKPKRPFHRVGDLTLPITIRLPSPSPSMSTTTTTTTIR